MVVAPVSGRGLVWLGLGTIAAAGTYAYMRPGGSARTLAVDALSLLTGSIDLDAEQRRNVEVISDEFARAGLADWTVAAVANAYAESALRAGARSLPPEDSVGLFQLNARGAGSGMSTAQRQDPRQNTKRIIDEAHARVIASASPRTEGDAVDWFATHVERCALCFAGGPALLERRAYANRLFGSGTTDRAFGSSGRIA